MRAPSGRLLRRSTPGASRRREEGSGTPCQSATYSKEPEGEADMLVTTGLWVAAVGLVALSLESIETALVLFGIAGLLIRLA